MAGESTDVAKSDIVRLLDRLTEQGDRYWRPVHESIRDDRIFYDGDHYDEPDRDPDDKRPTAFRFVGQDTFNVVRHNAGQLTDRPRITEAILADESYAEGDEESAVALIESVTQHPQKGFDEYIDMMAVSACAAQVGIVWIDYDPDLGKHGEITFRPGDALRVMWEPGYHDPHDLRCDWLRERRYPTVAELRETLGKSKYTNKAVLKALKGEPGLTEDGESISGGTTNRDETERTGDNQSDDKVVCDWWWFKNDRTKVRKTRPLDSTDLPDESRYMVCGSPGAPGCGWRGDPQAGLPEEGMCPECGQPSMRVDSREPYDELLVYPKGKRLVIHCPNQKSSEPLYDGPWPIMQLADHADARTFPLYLLTRYLPADPSKPCGPSDTSLNQTAQAASDYLVTKTFHAAAQFQRYYNLPETGVNDWQGQRFEFREDQFNVMFRSLDDQRLFGPNGSTVQVIDGSQFDPSVPAVWGMVQQVLNGKQGIADFGLASGGADPLKGVAATTAVTATQQADIPMEHLRRRFHRAIARGHGYLYDLIRACGTRKYSVKVANGAPEVVEVRGDELPNFYFVVDDAPSFTGLEARVSEGLDKLIQVAKTAPAFLEVYADANNIPRSILRKVQKQLAVTAPPTGPLGANADVGASVPTADGLPVPPGGPVDQMRTMQQAFTAPQMAGA